MMKIMLIGDSIRLGYQKRVAQLLKDRATIAGPDDNCRFSAYTLFYVSQWVADDDYDAIQWNNGQWDVCYMPDGRIHTPLDMYVELQDRIAAVLRPKTKRLIFATTTPVWPEQFSVAPVNPRKNDDIRAYNAAAAEKLAGVGVEINDLHGALATDIKRYICPDMVHLTDDGIDVCASTIAQCAADTLRS